MSKVTFQQKKRPQASEGASHAPKINKDIAQIAFHQHSAELIWRRSRAIAHQVSSFLFMISSLPFPFEVY